MKTLLVTFFIEHKVGKTKWYYDVSYDARSGEWVIKDEKETVIHKEANRRAVQFENKTTAMQILSNYLHSQKTKPK